MAEAENTNYQSQRERLIQRLREKASTGQSRLSPAEMEDLISRITEENRNGMPVEHKLMVDFAVHSQDQPRSVLALNLLEEHRARERTVQITEELEALLPRARELLDAEERSGDEVEKIADRVGDLLKSSTYSPDKIAEIKDGIRALYRMRDPSDPDFERAFEPVLTFTVHYQQWTDRPEGPTFH